MKLDFFFFYAEANIVCILILAVMLINDRLHGTRQEKQIWFNWTVVAHICYFISDIAWAAVLGGLLPRTRYLVGLFNFSNFVLLNLLAFEWFMYMAASEEMNFRKSRRKRTLCRLPMTLAIVAIVIAYTADPKFWISDSGELNDLYYPMMIFAPVLYLTAALVISMRNARKSNSREEKRLYRLIGTYPLGVLAFGLIQVFILNAPMFCFGCTVMMLFFYIQNMQALVSVDALTRLNNRGQINRYMDQTVFRDNVKTYVMMIDIDHFKEINDTYGHAEGDRALILVAEALKKICERVRVPVFLGRYGGDEVTIFIQDPQEDGALPEQVAQAIREALAEKQLENRLPYELKASIGCEALADRNDTMAACMARADEKLYENKRKAS